MEILDHSENIVDSNSNFTNLMRGYLTETAKWAKFLSIISFIGITFFVFIAIAVAVTFSGHNVKSGGGSFYADNMGIIMCSLYLLIGLSGLIPTIYMLKFSSGILKNMPSFTIGGIEKALSNLKSLFKYCGIATIACFIFYLLLIVFVVMGDLQKIF